MYLSPPNSCYQWTSRSLVFTNFPNPAILPDCICQTSPTSFRKFPKLTKLQNTLHTLKGVGLCLDTNTNGLLGVLFSLTFQILQYCPIASTKPHQLLLANSQNSPSSKTLSTLWIGVGFCLDTNLLSMYNNGRGNEKKLQWFLTKGWVALSLKGGCVVETSRVSMNSLFYFCG